MKFMKILLMFTFTVSLARYTEVKKLECAAVFLPENPIIVEAGACRGGDTQKMANLWSKGIIHAFEPLPEHFATLTKNTSELSNVICYKYGLGIQNGTFPFHVSERNGKMMNSSSLLSPKEHLNWCKDIIFSEVISIDVLTLDAWAKKYNVYYVDFMWLDLQGSELDVLKACPKLLKTVKAIWTEATYGEMYKECARYPQLKQFLENEGFTFVCTSGGLEFMFDALFVRNDVYKEVTSQLDWPALLKSFSREKG